MKREYARTLVPEWEREHPNATQQECADALGVSRRTVCRFTSKRTNISPEKAEQIVCDWFDKNPTGTNKKCAEELNISTRTVSKYYAFWKFKNELKKGSHEPNTEQIAMFTNSNS